MRSSPPPTRHAARVATTAVLGALGAALGACGDAPAELTGEPLRDRTAPRVTLAEPGGAGARDSGLVVLVTATDDLGLQSLEVTARLPLPRGGDTTLVGLRTRFTTAVTTVSQPVSFVVPPEVPRGTPVTVRATAVDGAGNATDAEPARRTVGNLPPARAVVSAPVAGTTFVIGRAGTVTVTAISQTGVRWVGYEASGAGVERRDSVAAPLAVRDTVSVELPLPIPPSASAGIVTLTPFVRDTLGRERATGTPVRFAVQPLAAVATSPVVTAGLTRRVEQRDTVRVGASDPTGICAVGVAVVNLATRDTVVTRSAPLAGEPTAAGATITVDLPDSLVGRPVGVLAFAVNGAGRRAFVRVAGARPPADTVRVDTVLVTAGITHPLPGGGTLVDGLYVPHRDRLYLSNVERNQLEVFDLTRQRFEGAITVGSRPWGLAPWPRDRSGRMGDTLLVANSGGTNVSYVRIGAEGGQEVYRYPLPNILVYSVTTVKSENTGSEMQQRTVYDFSDRPQYLATTCRDDPDGDPTACGEVVLVYSTTPTLGQPAPFPRRGTVRSENLTRCTSHFFFEHAVGQSARRADTLEIVRFAAHGTNSLPASCDAAPDSTILLPYRQQLRGEDGTTRPYSVVARLDELAFRDTTYVRNSGNFSRAVLGEGGAVRGSRAIAFDARRGLVEHFDAGGQRWTFEVPVIDQGVSQARDVSDFIANAFTAVRGVAINFDGALAAVRADSTYLIDPSLRLQGLLPSSGGANAGFDFHPLNRGPGAGPGVDPLARYAFSASAAPQIEVFDSYTYRLVRTVEVRDPIIGPVRAVRRPATGDVVLVGATARGVVVVPLDAAGGGARR